MTVKGRYAVAQVHRRIDRLPQHRRIGHPSEPGIGGQCICRMFQNVTRPAHRLQQRHNRGALPDRDWRGGQLRRHLPVHLFKGRREMREK